MKKNFKLTGCNLFVIPNPVLYMESFTEGYQKRIKEAAELNGWQLSPEELIIDVWLTSDQVGNVFCDTYRTASGNIDSHIATHLPLSPFKDHREGDILHLIVPASIYNGSHREDCTLECDAELNQRGYRYGAFGNFEDVVARLIGK